MSAPHRILILLLCLWPAFALADYAPTPKRPVELAGYWVLDATTSEDPEAMLAEGRDCRDVVTQMSAANKALEQAGFVLVAAGLTWCLEDPERSKAEGYDISDVQKLFTKLA